MGKLEIAAVVLVLVAIVGLPAAAFSYQSLRDRGYDGQVITLTGAHGVWSQETIRVRQGEKLRLRLTSNDVVHGFMLKGYDVEIDEVYPGRVKDVEFVADEPGSFPFACTILCSPHHRHMKGKLIVEPSGGQAVSVASERN